MSDFSWDGADADSVVLPRQPRVAVYSGKQGHVVIRQEDDWGDEDSQIILTPQGALAVAWALIEEAQLVGVPQPSISLMPVNADGKPEPLDPGLAAMCRSRHRGREVPTAKAGADLLNIAEAAE